MSAKLVTPTYPAQERTGEATQRSHAPTLGLGETLTVRCHTPGCGAKKLGDVEGIAHGTLRLLCPRCKVVTEMVFG